MFTVARRWKKMVVVILTIMTIVITPTISSAAPGGFRLPFYGTLDISTGPRCYSHYDYNAEAIDFSGPLGYEIRASKDGVAHFGYESVGGNYVKVYHQGGLVSTYAHLNGFEPSRYWLYRNTKNNGVWVRQGDVIGYMGKSGNATGVHLHFAVHTQNRSPVVIYDMPGLVWSGGNPTDIGCELNGRPEGKAYG